MSTERPILLSEQLVRAILDGRKTQTRRPILFSERLVRSILDGRKTQTRRLVKSGHRPAAVGDLLWVREAHCFTGGHHVLWPDLPHTTGYDHGLPVVAYYRASFDRAPPDRWRPSIHMPRWASRITLRVTDVRRQRLHEITPAEVLAEGIGIPALRDELLLEAWEDVWDGINGKRAGCAWADNPEVWAYTFEVGGDQ